MSLWICCCMSVALVPFGAVLLSSKCWKKNLAVAVLDWNLMTACIYGFYSDQVTTQHVNILSDFLRNLISHHNVHTVASWTWDTWNKSSHFAALLWGWVVIIVLYLNTQRDDWINHDLPLWSWADLEIAAEEESEWKKWLTWFLMCFPSWDCLTGSVTVLVTFSKHLSHAVKPRWIWKCHLFSWAILVVYAEGNTYADFPSLYTVVLVYRASSQNSVRNLTFSYWLKYFPI